VNHRMSKACTNKRLRELMSGLTTCAVAGDVSEITVRAVAWQALGLPVVAAVRTMRKSGASASCETGLDCVAAMILRLRRRRSAAMYPWANFLKNFPGYGPDDDLPMSGPPFVASLHGECRRWLCDPPTCRCDVIPFCVRLGPAAELGGA